MNLAAIKPYSNNYLRNGEEYPPSVQRKLDGLDSAGNGLHFGLYGVALELRHYVAPNRGFNLLYQAGLANGYNEREAAKAARECMNAWDNIPAGASQPYIAPRQAPPAPTINFELVRKIVADYGEPASAYYDLWERSLIRFDEWQSCAATPYVLGHLFTPDEIIWGDIVKSCVSGTGASLLK
jgi:hypothetical protein